MTGETCPICGAEVIRYADRTGQEWLCEPGQLYEEFNHPDAEKMLSLSGYVCMGVPVHTCTGGHIGWRVHDCRPPRTRFELTNDEDDLPW